MTVAELTQYLNRYPHNHQVLIHNHDLGGLPVEDVEYVHLEREDLWIVSPEKKNKKLLSKHN